MQSLSTEYVRRKLSESTSSQKVSAKAEVGELGAGATSGSRVTKSVAPTCGGSSTIIA